MGSIITLSIGNLEIDWGKNFSHIDHSPLFFPQKNNKESYFYIGDDGEKITEEKDALVAKLSDIVPRLELLGFTTKKIEEIYYEPVVSGYAKKSEMIPFSTISKALKIINVETLSPNYSDEDYDPGEFSRKEIISRLGIKAKSPREWFKVEMLENFHPWGILRLLAFNKKNLDLPVIWRYKDVVENGWINEEEILKPLKHESKYLLVTEGSSDSKILDKAIKILFPGIEDFFTFVDMEEGYPFTGTGNLFNFVKGLSKIGVTNQIIVIFDNDTEGRAKYLEAKKIRFPDNLRIFMLPDLSELESFNTIGPSGRNIENINGRAVAIECFLDLTKDMSGMPTVRWTSYNQKLDSYQGELINKEDYTKKFLESSTTKYKYGYSKLTHLIQTILAEATDINKEL